MAILAKDCASYVTTLLLINTSDNGRILFYTFLFYIGIRQSINMYQCSALARLLGYLVYRAGLIYGASPLLLDPIMSWLIQSPCIVSIAIHLINELRIVCPTIVQLQSNAI